MNETGADTVVIGLGNPLMADDGLGLAALELLEREWRLPASVRLVDGGTWGLQLLPIIEQAGAVLLVDAIDAGGAPGDLIIMGREELPRLLAHKLSSHQVALAELLAVCDLRGSIPARLAALGLQPARIEMSTTLSPEVAGRVGDLALAVVAQLEAWGHDVVPAPRTCKALQRALPVEVC